jgi:hypothetical protein
MRHSYVVPMRWVVICEYEVPGGALNVNSTKVPSPWSPWGSSTSRKNLHGRTGNRTRDLIISSQKLWPLDHEAGHISFIHKSGFSRTVCQRSQGVFCPHSVSKIAGCILPTLCVKDRRVYFAHTMCQRSQGVYCPHCVSKNAGCIILSSSTSTNMFLTSLCKFC